MIQAVDQSQIYVALFSMVIASCARPDYRWQMHFKSSFQIMALEAILYLALSIIILLIESNYS